MQVNIYMGNYTDPYFATELADSDEIKGWVELKGEMTP